MRAQRQRRWWGSGAKPPEAESFSSILIQRRSKSLVFKLKKTPMFGSWGEGEGGRPVRPYLSRSASDTVHVGTVSGGVLMLRLINSCVRQMTPQWAANAALKTPAMTKEAWLYQIFTLHCCCLSHNNSFVIMWIFFCSPALLLFQLANSSILMQIATSLSGFWPSCIVSYCCAVARSISVFRWR